MDADDALLSRLRDLPPADLDAAGAERLRWQAQAVLSAKRRLLGRPWLAALDRAFEQVLLPDSLSGAVAVYLLWVVLVSSQLLRGG